MLERISALPAGIDGLRAQGPLTRQDMVNVLEPLLEEARQQGRRLRLLLEVGSYRGPTADALWQDLRIGLHHLRRFERCAVVTDDAWARTATQIKGALFGKLICPMQAFPSAERKQALDWLAGAGEPALIPHRLVPERGILVLEPQSPLRQEDFEAVSATVDPWLEANGTLRGVVIRARTFPGWENAAGLLTHLRFVRDHHRKVRRIAIVTDMLVADLAQKVATHFTLAEVKHFPYAQMEQALTWAEAESAGTGTTPSASAHS